MRILLADDDNAVRRVFQVKLERKGHDVETAADGVQALELLQQGDWDVLVSDIRMPKMDGIELLEQLRKVQPELKVVLMTAHATVSQAVQAVKLGAFDYITKPFEDDELFAIIEKAGAFRQLEQENRRLRGRLNKKRNLIGVSRAFKDTMLIVKQIAATDATVLLMGASGTGKELLAREIHARSNRSGGAFVAVNCGAIPRDLMESELFGHVKGAFTGATRSKRGKFELAHGGSILLDEVGELPVDLQVKLLRVLQERVVEPVGAERSLEVDVRVIASTNADLQAYVEEGKFREDLFYRLNVIPIAVPSLSERRDDIVLLARTFMESFAKGSDVEMDEPLVEKLLNYHWPGNIRELENLVERMVLLRRGNVLTVKDLPADFASGSTATDSGRGVQVTFQEAEERLVRNALEKHRWNRAGAARALDIPRHVLIYRMQKYGIKPPGAE